MPFLSEATKRVRAKNVKLRRMYDSLVRRTKRGTNYPEFKNFRSHVFQLPEVCEYCERPLLDYSWGMHLEHKTPTSRGGKLWDYDNLSLSCENCNMVKGVLTAGEFKTLTQGNMEAFYALFPEGEKPYWLKPGKKWFWKWKRK